MSGKSKTDILHELFQGQIVGGALSELANYSDLFMRMRDPVFLLDRTSHRVLECNPAALALLKKEEHLILGHGIEDFFPGVTLSLGVTQGLAFKDQSGSPAHYEVSTTEVKILDYISVFQFLVKDVTEVRTAQIELEEANQVLKKLSTTDEMTGLWNFRYFKEALAAVHHQSSLHQDEYAVVFLDVDHFKKFNDRNGHPAGDEVLKKVAKILKQTVQPNQIAARYGGEEFVILCKSTPLASAMETAEKVRTAITQNSFPFGEHQPLGLVSVSVGVAHYPSCGLTAEEVLHNADLALYQSKERGRNCVTDYLDVVKRHAA